MIDTIALTLNEGMFTIVEHDKFSPSTRGLYSQPYYTLGGRGSINCVQNPTSSDFRNGIYKPRLTATRRIAKGGFQKVLRVELSLPKLVFGNNFDELTEDYFASILTILKDRLKEMGVWVRQLEDAPVSAVHFSKNVILTDGSTPYVILQELRKTNISQRLDTNQTDYRNEGHSFKYRTNSFEVALYDKLKDLQQAKISEKRAEEKDNALQLNLFDSLRQATPFEVLRIEIRLNKRQKIRSELAALGFEVEPTFKSLFNQSISKAVLLKNWSDIEDGYRLLEYKPKDTKELVTQIMAHNPNLTPRKALQMIGLKTVMEEVGIRELRSLTRSNQNNWYRLNKEALELQWPQNRYTPMATIRKALTEFDPVRLANHKEL